MIKNGLHVPQIGAESVRSAQAPDRRAGGRRACHHPAPVQQAGAGRRVERTRNPGAGPFSMTQNPLYFFSTVGAAGIGLMFGSVLAAALLGLGSFLVFRFTARKE